MILSDTTIAQMLDSGDLVIEPEPGDKQMQPVSVDLILGNSWCRLPSSVHDSPTRFISDEVVLGPGQFILATTKETVGLPSYLAGTVVGKSSWARRAIMVECAGLVDPGFRGQITLEVANLGPLPRALRAGEPICQIMFMPVDRAVTRPYGTPGLGSHYQDQRGAEPSRG